MGTSIHQTKASFGIHKDNMDLALGLLKGYARDLIAGKAHVHYRGDYKPVLTEPHLDGALREFGWGSKYDEEGNCTEVYYELGNSDNEEEVLRRLAPAVNDGSFIEFRFPYGKVRYTFTGGKLYRQEEVSTWGDPVEVKP